MKLLFIGQGRFGQFDDHNVYPLDNQFHYDFFDRYLKVFDQIIVCSRLWMLDGLPSQPIQASTGPGVIFIGIPPFTTVVQYVRSLPCIWRTIRQAISDADAFLLRVPNYMGFLTSWILRQSRLPYAVEVVGDPNDVFQPGAVDHPLRPLIRILGSYELKWICSHASGAAYVTERTLQRRYPARSNAFTTNYSTIDLPGAVFVSQPRRYSVPATRLVFVGSLEVMYKAPEIMIEALKILAERGTHMALRMVGGGRCQPHVESLTQRWHLTEKVVFHGTVPADTVVSHLNNAEIFVLPSRVEGLPRAMIEAMARGLPCIGSTAGGIPELLPQEDMVPIGNAKALADKIMEVASDPDRLTRMSARNLTVAQSYRQDLLQVRRTAFYQKIRKQAETRLHCSKCR